MNRHQVLDFALPLVAASLLLGGLCTPRIAAADEYFLKGSGATVYAVHEGRRHPIATPECYFAVAGRRSFSETRTIEDATLFAMPEGPPVVCDHSFVKFGDTPAIFLSTGNTLRWLNDPPCALANGMAPNMSNVVNVDPRWRNAFAYGQGVCGPDSGSRFIKGSPATVYALADGRRHAIANPGCFRAIGGRPDFSDVETLPDAAVAAIQEGVPVVCDHALVKFPSGPTIYLSVGNTLRGLNSPACAFANGMAADGSNVQGVDGRQERHFAFGRSMCPGAEPAPSATWAPPPPPAPVYVAPPTPVYVAAPAPVYFAAPAPVYVAAPAPVYVEQVVVRDCGTGADPGCGQRRDGRYAMDADTYKGLYESARATANEITRSEMLLTAFADNYLTTSQFVSFLDLFRNELTKMDIARAGAPKVVDPKRALSYGPRIVNTITRQEYLELIGQQR